MVVPRRTLLFGMAFLLLSQILYAQEEDKLGTWLVYNGFINIKSDYELLIETQYRTWEPVNNTQTWMFRPFLSYRVTDNFLPGIGLEYHINRSFSENNSDRVKTQEFRISLQTILLQNIGTAFLQHRYRYEFRFWDFEGRERMRYRIQASIPLTKKDLSPGVVFATLGNEFLIDTKPALYLSENWWYVMAGYRINESLFIQAGYLGIIRPGDENLHRIQVLFTQRLFVE